MLCFIRLTSGFGTYISEFPAVILDASISSQLHLRLSKQHNTLNYYLVKMGCVSYNIYVNELINSLPIIQQHYKTLHNYFRVFQDTVPILQAVQKVDPENERL